MFCQMNSIEYPSFDLSCIVKKFTKSLLTYTVLVTKEFFLHDQKNWDEERRWGVLST